MMKSVLATIGVVAIVVGIAVWQFGFFSEKAQEISKNMERATASARVNKAIADYRDNIGKLDEKARYYNVEARKMELAWEREQQKVDDLKNAINQLAQAAKNAGLPKPSDVAGMTDEQKNATLSFGQKSVTGADVYTTLERWFEDLKVKENAANVKKETIDRMRALAEKIKSKKSVMTEELAKMEGRVKELEGARDVAKLNAELAEMEASLSGVAAGDAGKAMTVLQDEIDELNSLADTYQTEAQTKDSELNPSDIIAPVDDSNALDAFWN